MEINVQNWHDQYIYRAKPFPTTAIEKYSGVFFKTESRYIIFLSITFLFKRTIA